MIVQSCGMMSSTSLCPQACLNFLGLNCPELCFICGTSSGDGEPEENDDELLTSPQEQQQPQPVAAVAPYVPSDAMSTPSPLQVPSSSSTQLGTPTTMLTPLPMPSTQTPVSQPAAVSDVCEDSTTFALGCEPALAGKLCYVC